MVELLVQLAGICVFAVSWYPCPDCCQDTDCEHCSSGTTPTEYDLTFSGVANENCTTCANMNTTFTLTQDGGAGQCVESGEAGTCCYEITLTECGGDLCGITIIINADGARVNVIAADDLSGDCTQAEAINDDGAGSSVWRGTGDYPWDCTQTFSGDMVNNASSVIRHCDWASATGQAVPA